MVSPQWSESLETGDALVDQQHRSIHALVEYVEAAKDDPQLLMRVLERLMEHVDCHFATEEALMEKTGFTGARAVDHIAEHRKLTAGARDIVLRFRTGEIREMEPVVEFLRDWLADHVHACDRMFIEHVRALGAIASLPEPWASQPLSVDDLVA